MRARFWNLPLVLVMAGVAWAGETDHFASWNEAVDRFLAQSWRISNYSSIGAKAKLMKEMPGPEACFETLMEALPPSEHWHELPTITRARLQKGQPRTSAEALAWMDRRLLHLWVLMLNLPGTEAEIQATLDDLRTLRWLVKYDVLEISQDERLDFQFEERLRGLDQFLRSEIQPAGGQISEVEAFRKGLCEAHETPQQRVIEAIGLSAYKRLQDVASRRASAGQEGCLIDPAAQAWLDFGPLPQGAEEAFEGRVAGVGMASDLQVPDLVKELGEEGARSLIQEALAIRVPLRWSEAGSTAIAVAGWLVEGRLDASLEWSVDFLNQLLATWETPSTPRGEAGLALIAALESRFSKPRPSEEEENEFGVKILKNGFAADAEYNRARCLLACGRGLEAAQALEKGGCFSMEIPAPIESEHPRAVTEFLMRWLPQHPDMDFEWGRMQAQAHRVGLDAEALKVMLDNREKIQDGAESLILKARLDAGQIEAAAATLQDIVKRPFIAKGFRTEARVEALITLLRLGDEQQQPRWCQLALDRLRALMTYWETVMAGCSDGGDPWAKLPGLLACRGRLDLALAAAKLNVRWRMANAMIGAVFLMPDQESQDYLLTGPASAMAGLIQVWTLQKKPQAILDYLDNEAGWPARDLLEVASYADPSFPEPLRQPIGNLVAGALDALGRKEEAQRIRDRKTDGPIPALVAFLASDRSAGLSPEDRKALQPLVANHVEDGERADLIRIAGALEQMNLAPETWQDSQWIFPLKAAAIRIDGWMNEGPPVPMPPVKSLRTVFLAAAALLVPVRDALLSNVPRAY